MEFIKKLIPSFLLKFLRPYYHGFLAIVASWYFGNPSSKLIVIGVTGTAGKSTTVAILAHLLNKNGKRCGYMTTVNFFDGEKDFINKHGLSMPGGWMLQKQLKQILAKGCKYAVIECTSEGLAQNRHLGINFDVALFTNLTRAHLEAHGSFGNYQAAKAKLFLALQKNTKKTFFPKTMVGVNLDDPMSGYFLSFVADTKFGLSFKGIKAAHTNKVFNAKVIKPETPLEFEVDQVPFVLNMLGDFNIKNACLAIVAANMLEVSLKDSENALKDFNGVRGRMESVPNSLGIKIIVDYGCEPASFRSAVEAASLLPHKRLILVFGSTGGHRDVSKRFEFGKIAATYADYIIITNDDVYESKPEEIAANIEVGIKDYELRKPKYEIVLDRKAAIKRALTIAEKDDIVLITGKGSEQFLVLPGNKRIEWDETEVVWEEANKLTPGYWDDVAKHHESSLS